MRHNIQIILALLFTGIVLPLIGCGHSNSNDNINVKPIGITIKSPKFNEIESMYADVDVSLKFTDSSGKVTECNVFIGTDLKVKGTCGDISLGAYSYKLEYKYQGLYIAKSIGMMTFDKNSTEITITLLDKSMDEDKDGCSNLQEVVVGSDPNVADICVPPPSSLKAVAVSIVQVDLTWNETTVDGSGYKIFRRKGTEGSEIEIGTTVELSYSDKELDADTEYCYKVLAYNGDAESLKTDSVCAKTENGLVAFYPFNGNANDESGNGNDGTVNGATLTKDRFGNANSAYSFDGSTSFIEVSDNPQLRLSVTDFTISVWVLEMERNLSYFDSVLFKRTNNSNDGWMLGVAGKDSSPNTGEIYFRVSIGTEPTVTSTEKITLESWHHILIRYNYQDELLSIYLDGSLKATQGKVPSPNKSTGVNLFIGKDSNKEFNRYHFHGLIDDIRIYNRALTESEIQVLYNEPDPIDTPKANAGQDQSVTPGSLVTLDGSASRNATSYNWTMVSRPDGSSATLSDSTLTNPTFTADIEGEYIISLTVSDGSENSEPDTVIITALIVTIPTEGLVAYYPFNGNANDKSGNGKNGTVNGATLSADRFGNENSAYRFDGINDYINVGTVSTVYENSVSVWTKPNSLSAGIVVGHVAGPSQACSFGWHIRAQSETICYDADPSGCGTSNSICKNGSYGNTWTYITGTFDGNVERLYINGLLVEEKLGVSFAPSSWMTIGTATFFNGNQQFFSGDVDDIRVYNRALSEDEINALYNEGN